MNSFRTLIAAAAIFTAAGAATAQVSVSTYSPAPGKAVANLVAEKTTTIEVKAFAQAFGNGHGRPVIISQMTLNGIPVGGTETTSGENGEIHAHMNRLVTLHAGRNYELVYTADNRNADAGKTTLQIKYPEQLASN